MSNLYKQ